MKKELIRKIITLFCMAGLLALVSTLLAGCGIVLDSEQERDQAIEDCKNAGGTPFVENYDDSRLRPIVHCNFGEEK